MWSEVDDPSQRRLSQSVGGAGIGQKFIVYVSSTVGEYLENSICLVFGVDQGRALIKAEPREYAGQAFYS